jgi:hypothetical protein
MTIRFWVGSLFRYSRLQFPNNCCYGATWLIIIFVSDVALRSYQSALSKHFPSDIVPFLVWWSAESCINLWETKACDIKLMHCFIYLHPICVIFDPIYVVEEKTLYYLHMVCFLFENSWSLIWLIGSIILFESSAKSSLCRFGVRWRLLPIRLIVCSFLPFFFVHS